MSKHAILDKIEQELNGVRVTEPVKIGSHTYGLSVLDGGEESLAKSLVPQTVALWQALSDTNTQTLAVALRSIDDTPVERIFELPAGGEERDEALRDEKRWRSKQIVEWLLAKPAPFLRALWTGYSDIQQRSFKALEDLKGL